MAWWIAEKGTPLEYLGATEVNQEAAKRAAVARSTAKPGTIVQVRYRVNANATTEVRWLAIDGTLTEVTGAAQRNP